MSYRGSRFPREQNSSPGTYRARGRGGGGQGFGRGRGRGGGYPGSGTDFNPNPPEQNPAAAASTGVYQHPHASRGRGRGGWGRGGQNSWSNSNGSGGSGASTPRGYPPRNNKFSHSSHAPTPRGGGLGFHQNTSNRPPQSNFPRSGAEPPRTTRGTSDPRLWIPVKFVKATALTDEALATLEKNTLLSSDKVKERQAAPPPLVAPEIRPEPAPPSPSDRLWEIEELTPASVEKWQTDFPGIFQKECSISTFQSPPSATQAIDSSAPQKVSQSVSESKSIALPSPDNDEDFKTHDTSHESKPATGPEAVQSVPSDSAAQTLKSTAASDGAPQTGSAPADSGALFFIDAEGDPDYKPTDSSIQVSTLESSVNKETDDEEERIVFRADQSAPLESPTSNSHLFRTITDESPVQTLVADVPAAPDLGPAQSKSLASKPSKQAIKARKRDARKQRRKSTLEGQPDGADHRPDDVESGSDINWGDDNSQEPIVTSAAGEKAPQAVSSKAQRRAAKDKEEMELCEDYIKHAMMAEAASGNDEPDGPDSKAKFLNDSFTKTFMEGMAAQEKHTTIDELDQDAQNEMDDDAMLKQQQFDWKADLSDSSEEEIDDLSLYESDSEEEPDESDASDESLDDEDDPEAETSLEKSIDVSSESSDASDEKEALELIADVKSGKGKEKKGAADEDGDSELVEFIDDLQKKWKLDRARKAERKKARAEARRQSEPKTKKQRKKADKKASTDPPPDVPTLNNMIRDFICFQTDEQTLTLPPVDKKSRAAVHQIANLYKMISKSHGSGRHRYPVLTRTHRTTHILRSRRPLFAILNRFTDPGGTRARSVALVPRNREGALVGQGVAHIGAENVGFKLLTKMGWSFGETIGDPNNTSALQKPLMAVMKNSKGGLGLASHNQFHNC
ncbi:hypothetical protein PCANC_10966 [Puccinia coronata f. sp. avenae]|uniref:Protein SQS1 n=1 Tax=Puccinia coronata f. sp. avenae TaxID=200324 RepID=A0A2N5UWI1_9BASI|nr:hypothetical protein PCANC_10966 [Puccinia coronata f. sp. avenae]